VSRDPKSSYYDAGDIEVFDIIRAKLTPEELQGFYKGNAIKYLARMAFKGDSVRDAEKAANYTQWLSDLLADERKRMIDEEAISEVVLNKLSGRKAFSELPPHEDDGN